MIQGIVIAYVDDVLIVVPQCHIDVIVKFQLERYVMKCSLGLLMRARFTKDADGTI